MGTESISRRLAALEAKVIPKLSPLDVLLCQNEKFVALVHGQGLNIDDLKRTGSVLGVLPRDLLRALVDSLKRANAAGRTG